MLTKTTSILCCNCGAAIDGTVSAGALCNDCIRLSVDISEGVQREATLHTCRDCDRWLSPPSQWLVAQPESRELLALCLRKLRGLSKVRVIDASFIWTEPHSRRIKVKITVQKEAFQDTILQQTFDVEYIVAYYQCPDCAKSYTKNTWRACVQVRQKVSHKRTFLYLEQLILKHNAHKDTLNIKETNDGIDFFFSQRNQAERFVDFLSSVVPVKTKKSQELISMDIHTSARSLKFTFSCELIPICRDDLVALPLKLAKQIGDISPLVLCYRIGTAINTIDPSTLQTAQISSQVYWRSPFAPIGDSKELVEFIVMDIEPTKTANGRFALAEVTVTRSSDLGVNDTTYFARTHLGAILHVGDVVMGYHLSETNFNNKTFEAIESSKQYSGMIPDVILVKKQYSRKRSNKSRKWHLKRMEKEESEMVPRKQEQDRLERDFEMFLQDVEGDTELRNALSLFKTKTNTESIARAMEGVEKRNEEIGHEEEEEEEEEEGEGEEEQGLRIPMEQLLDEMEDMDMEDDG